jgi:phage terminase large subunit-like protein
MSSLLAERLSGLAEFEAFSAELTTEDGDPFVLEAFQKTILEDYFDGVRSTVIIMPKKNGKTTLIAALAVYHLLTVPNADCIIVAASREQAGICLKAARIFIRNSTSLSALMAINQRTISLVGEEGRIRILASDEATLDGENPTLAIVDELHRHKDLDVYGVLSDGLTRPGAAMITISTAGSNLLSPLGEIRTAAHEMEGFTRISTYNHVRSADGAFAFHEWCLDPEADFEDLEVVKTANPAPWQTIERLRTRRTEPGMSTYRWLRFACGIWTEGEEPWIEPAMWDALGGAKAPQPKEGIWAAVAVGNREEESAVLVVTRRDGQLYVGARIFEEAAEIAELEEEIRTLRKTHRLMSVSYDPRQFRSAAETLSREGLTMVEFPMTQDRMAKASATLWRSLERKELHHADDKRLRAHILAGVVKEDVRGWQVTRDPRRRASVEGLMALMMGVQAASDQPDRKALMAWA